MIDVAGDFAVRQGTRNTKNFDMLEKEVYRMRRVVEALEKGIELLSDLNHRLLDGVDLPETFRYVGCVNVRGEGSHVGVREYHVRNCQNCGGQTIVPPIADGGKRSKKRFCSVKCKRDSYRTAASDNIEIQT